MYDPCLAEIGLSTGKHSFDLIALSKCTWYSWNSFNQFSGWKVKVNKISVSQCSLVILPLWCEYAK